MTFSAFRSIFVAGGIALSAMVLTSCAHTQLTSTSKDPAFKAKDMHHVLILVLVRKPKNQQLIEEEFSRQLKKKGADGVASYTMVRQGEPLDEAAWKQLVTSNHFDAVIVSRLIKMDEEKKEEVNSDYKVLAAPSTGYGYYGYRYVYQPGYSTVPEETAILETRIFNVADDKMVWSAHTKTDIEWGRDPDAQFRDFVSAMMKVIYQ